MTDTEYAFEPWPVGTRFIIKNRALSGKLFYEGYAAIVSHNFENNYTVRFDNGDVVDRFLEGGDMVPGHGNPAETPR